MGREKCLERRVSQRVQPVIGLDILLALGGLRAALKGMPFMEMRGRWVASWLDVKAGGPSGTGMLPFVFP